MKTLFCLYKFFNLLQYSELKAFVTNYDIIHAFCLRLKTKIADSTIYAKILLCCMKLV